MGGCKPEFSTLSHLGIKSTSEIPLTYRRANPSIDRRGAGCDTGGMIRICKSPTADTRTCAFANTPKETLLSASLNHIADVGAGLAFFAGKLTVAASVHDYDKLTQIDKFHADFKGGFKETGWWDNHRKIHRHHIDHADGVPDDVNLLDVLEHVADCVMAGLARAGTVYAMDLSNELLQRALANTAKLLQAQVEVAK